MNAGQHLWLANVPLICFWIIEWHCPDRVMRQFGFDQPIPAAPVDIDWEHTQELKGKMEIGWESEQARYIRVWENSQARVCVAPFLYVPLTLQTSEYLKWYWKVTRRWISPENAVTVYTVLNQVFVVYSCVKLCFGSKELLNEGVVCCELQAMGVENLFEMNINRVEPDDEMTNLCARMLYCMGERGRLHHHPIHPAPPTPQFDQLELASTRIR
jgi:Plant mobile domain